MSFLRPTGTQWRTPQYGKSVIVSSVRGVTRVQAWPRKRGPAKTPQEQNRQTIFHVYQQLIKRLHPRECEYERWAIRQYNRTHRGQRGSAAIRFRDWQTQRLFGRGLLIRVPGLATFYPPAIPRDASQILDHVTDLPAALTVRTGTQWDALPIGAPRTKLTAGPVGTTPTWR